MRHGSGSIAMAGTDVHVPGYLVPLAFLYAAVGSVLGWMFGRPLMRTTNDLMENATNALEPEAERQTLEMLQRELPDAALLAISLHPRLGGLHHRALELSLAREALAAVHV